MRNLLAIAGAAMLLATAIPAMASPTGQVHWSGDVDDQVIVYVHRDQVTTSKVNDRHPRRLSVAIEGKLPDHRPSHVFLTQKEGRGFIKVIQQPGANNDYTAAVQISDPQPGRGHYDFHLRWDVNAYAAPQ